MRNVTHQTRKANGLCIDCGEPCAEHSMWRCKKHLRRASDQANAANEVKRLVTEIVADIKEDIVKAKLLKKLNRCLSQ